MLLNQGAVWHAKSVTASRRALAALADDNIVDVRMEPIQFLLIVPRRYDDGARDIVADSMHPAKVAVDAEHLHQGGSADRARATDEQVHVAQPGNRVLVPQAIGVT